MSVWVDDVDAMHQHCVAAGLDVTFPPTDMPWNVREKYLRHPDGHVFRVGAGGPSLIWRPGFNRGAPFLAVFWQGAGAVTTTSVAFRFPRAVPRLPHSAIELTWAAIRGSSAQTRGEN